MNVFKAVEEFHRKYGIRVGVIPEFPKHQERVLRKKLLEEEYEEYLAAENKHDFEEVARELVDIIYIVCGTAVSYGIPLDKVFEEVHNANMRKTGDARRDDGKILKPEGWQPPDIKKVLYDAGYEDSKK